MSQFARNAARPPRTAESIQSWLMHAIADRVGVAPDEIDIRLTWDHYDLTSVDALGILSKLEQWLGQSISPILLWNYPTIQTLAQRLAEDQG